MTSTMPAFLTALVNGLKTKLPGVQVSHAWPGPSTERETVFVGDEIRDASSEIRSIKSGRQHYDEVYSVPVEGWVFMPDGTPASAEAARTRACEFTDAVYDLLADTPRLVSTIQHAIVVRRDPAVLVPFEKGWGCQSVAEIQVTARHQ